MIISGYSNILTNIILLLSPEIVQFLAHDNKLTGKLPDLSKNTVLDRFEVSNNLLTGKLDKKIFELDSLRLLYLDGNQLTGELPKDFGKNKNLVDLYLNNNDFTGKIPDIPDDGVFIQIGMFH